MFWAKKPTKNEPYAESACGNYRIAVTRHDNVFKYTPFFKGERMCGWFTNADDAKRICENHSERSN